MRSIFVSNCNLEERQPALDSSRNTAEWWNFKTSGPKSPVSRVNHACGGADRPYIAVKKTYHVEGGHYKIQIVRRLGPNMLYSITFFPLWG